MFWIRSTHAEHAAHYQRKVRRIAQYRLTGLSLFSSDHDLYFLNVKSLYFLYLFPNMAKRYTNFGYKRVKYEKYS